MSDELLFSQPQYNTWIELNYNQNQADVLKYAQATLDTGYPEIVNNPGNEQEYLLELINSYLYKDIFEVITPANYIDLLTSPAPE